MWLMIVLTLFSQGLSHLDVIYSETTPQVYDWDCALACGKTILRWADVEPRDNILKNIIQPNRPISFRHLVDYFQGHGLAVTGYKISWPQLRNFLNANHGSPIIAHLDEGNGHFVIVIGLANGGVIVSDPAHGVHVTPEADFCQSWSGNILFFPELNGSTAALTASATAVGRCELLQGMRLLRP